VADYVNRNILCQAYVHIEVPKHLDDAGIENIRRHLQAFIASRGAFFLYEQIETDVEVKEGSLKFYMTMAGALYIAIGQYGSFRDGLNFLAQDAKRLAESVVSESLFMTRSRHGDTIRAEARTGVVGQLKTAVDKLEFIRFEMTDVSPAVTAKRIAAVQVDIENIVSNLRDPTDVPFVVENLTKLSLQFLPAQLPKDPKKIPTEQHLTLYREQRRELLAYLKKAFDKSQT
jgi:hypothetical protein